MGFVDKEIMKLKQYCQEIINSPRRMLDQKSKKKGRYIWCDDWEQIEILKYLFNGRGMYYEDPPPNRLKSNPLWSKEEIEQKAEALIEKHKTVEAIIDELRSQRNGRHSNADTAPRVA